MVEFKDSNGNKIMYEKNEIENQIIKIVNDDIKSLEIVKNLYLNNQDGDLRSQKGRGEKIEEKEI